MTTKAKPAPTDAAAFLSALRGGLTFLAEGAPGTGKSWLLGSIGELVEDALLLAPKPREINSYQYKRHGFDDTAEVFKDHRWYPSLGSYEATAFSDLERRVLGLYEDEEYGAVILDPFTDAASLLDHELLKGEQAASPKDLRDTIGYWGEFSRRLKIFTQALVGLASPTLSRPKHVLVAVHTQPTKEEDLKGNATADKKGKGIEFHGDVLPRIDGGYRRELAGEFDIVGLSKIIHDRQIVGGKVSVEKRYVVQLNATPEAHAKAAIAPKLGEDEVGNTMREVLEAVAAASNGGN